MRTLRSPTSAAEISPQLMADLIANLRKLCNLSGTGCTITELPNGISVDVPPQKFPILVNLTEDWYACDSAQATILSVSLDSDGKRIVSDTGQTAMCDDPAWDDHVEPGGGRGWLRKPLYSSRILLHGVAVAKFSKRRLLASAWWATLRNAGERQRQRDADQTETLYRHRSASARVTRRALAPGYGSWKLDAKTAA